MRCNHLEHTPVLFPGGMFHYCLLQVPVVKKNSVGAAHKVSPKWLAPLAATHFFPLLCLIQCIVTYLCFFLTLLFFLIVVVL